MLRTARSPSEHYRNKTQDCGWWLPRAEQTMNSARLCQGKSRTTSQPFKCYFGTSAHGCSCSLAEAKVGVHQEPAGSGLSLAAL